MRRGEGFGGAQARWTPEPAGDGEQPDCIWIALGSASQDHHGNKGPLLLNGTVSILRREQYAMTTMADVRVTRPARTPEPRRGAGVPFPPVDAKVQDAAALLQGWAGAPGDHHAPLVLGDSVNVGAAWRC